MAEYIDIGRDLLKLVVKPRYSFVCWLGCFIILLLPRGGSGFQFNSLLDKYEEIVRCLMLFSLLLWITEIFVCYGWDNLLLYNERCKILRGLETLSGREIDILCKAINHKSTTIYTVATDAGVNVLAHKKLVEASSHSNEYQNIYIIPEFVWKKINEQSVKDILRTRQMK